MPLLALNRKDTGGLSIRTKAPGFANKSAEQAADSTSGPRKRFQCGGIVAGAGITGIGRPLKRFLHANRHQLRLNAMLASRNGYIAS